MEIDIFPLTRKEGIHRYIGTGGLGILILLYIIGAYKAAEYIIGEDKELLCLLLSIPLFIGSYAVFILLVHGLKLCLYAYFKVNREELNNQATQEDMVSCIVKHIDDIQKKLDQMQYDAKTAKPQTIVIAPPQQSGDTQRSEIMPKLKETLKGVHRDLDAFIQQVQIDRIQLTEARAKRDKEKLEKILRYTRLVFLPHGFSNEEMYQIEEAVKLLVQCNGIVNCVSVNIEKNNLKQADLKNFAWNIGNQYNIEPELLALFVLNVFHTWFKNTEKESIRKTLRNTTGRYFIEIDENIIEHLPKLEEKVLDKNSK